MGGFSLTTPVVLMVFNRPEATARIFEAIRQAKPPQLLIVADGPRKARPDDPHRCAEVRRIVAQVDWPCRVLTNFSEENLGCRRRVSSGLDWVFEQVERAIILEDDCLPDSTFFRFCQEMLDRYRDDPRVGMISGDNFQGEKGGGRASYYFSRYFHVWGWATWRDRWQGSYDVDMAKWPSVKGEGWLKGIVEGGAERAEWKKNFEKTWRGQIDTWDFQWVFANWVEKRLCLLPAVNLVSNIGFDLDATHTKSAGSLADLKRHALSFPLVHPDRVERDAAADARSRHRAAAKGLLGWLMARLP